MTKPTFDVKQREGGGGVPITNGMNFLWSGVLLVSSGATTSEGVASKKANIKSNNKENRNSR